MSCIGRYHECSKCYGCDDDVRRVCELYKRAYTDLHEAQSRITLAFDYLEKAASSMNWMVDHDRS